jgi:hypothetical protein
MGFFRSRARTPTLLRLSRERPFDVACEWGRRVRVHQVGGIDAPMPIRPALVLDGRRALPRSEVVGSPRRGRGLVCGHGRGNFRGGDRMFQRVVARVARGGSVERKARVYEGDDLLAPSSSPASDRLVSRPGGGVALHRTTTGFRRRTREVARPLSRPVLAHRPNPKAVGIMTPPSRRSHRPAGKGGGPTGSTRRGSLRG